MSPKITISILFLFFLLIHINGARGEDDNASAGANYADRLALLAIKSKINYDPQGVMSSWGNDSIHFCQWQGVTCSRRHNNRVTALNLSSTGLVGSLSPCIGNLSFLRVIMLQKNSFRGNIPPQLGRLFRLQNLVLHTNSFEGEIPANLSRCSNLIQVALGANKLVGRIPKELTSLSMLKFFLASKNNFTSEIPLFIGNLTSLEIINLNYCYLQGSIPDIFWNLKKLRIIQLGMNNLVGTIPSSLYNLSSINEFSFIENQLSGSLPMNLGSMMPHLQMLNLVTNRFAGSLPPSLSNCSELEHIQLADNSFSGGLIDFGNLQRLKSVIFSWNNFRGEEDGGLRFFNSLSNCSNLEKLDLLRNQIRGVLPKTLGNFSTKLNYLQLSENSISGILPSSIGNLVSLAYLDLADNQFTGPIPESIGNLRNLEVLKLFRNKFSGKIPDSVGNLSLLLYLSMAENKLEGTIPTSLGKCRRMLRFSLLDNNLSGSIPTELFGLSSLSIMFNLGQNHLSGPIPQEVGNLKNLNELYLGDNALSGELPTSLSSCRSLQTLDLYKNFFQGSIPSSLNSLGALQLLDLSHNNFSGQIPRYLEEMPLMFLNLSFNAFEGEVPVKGVFANASGISIEGNKRVCGGMPLLHLPKCRIRDSKKRPRVSHALIVVISVISSLLVAAILSFFVLRWHIKKRKVQPPGSLLKESFFKVSYEKLLKATDGFSSAKLIGKGSFSSVYRGILSDGDGNGMIVAVKVLNLQQRGSSTSFITECEALRNIRHRNLLKVITSCSSIDFQGNDFKALVYEFMPNGSLDRWLHSSSQTNNLQNEVHRLGLFQGISIATDVAHALDYLHNRCENTILHCDLKPSNILLDKDMVAHVGDFGLAKFLLPESSYANQSSSVGIRGTVGYTAPEYGLGSEVSTSGDVYSYGILLLEMVTGKKPTDSMFQEGLNLHNYANAALPDRVLDIVDPILLNDEEEDVTIGIAASSNQRVEQAESFRKKEACLFEMIKIGVACSMESAEARMVISTVIHELNSVKRHYC